MSPSVGWWKVNSLQRPDTAYVALIRRPCSCQEMSVSLVQLKSTHSLVKSPTDVVTPVSGSVDLLRTDVCMARKFSVSFWMRRGHSPLVRVSVTRMSLDPDCWSRVDHSSRSWSNFSTPLSAGKKYTDMLQQTISMLP